MLAHSILYFLVRAGNGLLGIVTLAVFARGLSPAEYGTYALVVASSGILGAVGYQWLSVSVGRFYPAHRANPGIVIQAVTRGFWQATATILVVAALASALGIQSGVDDPVLLLLLLALAITLGRYNVILQFANAKGRPLAYGLMTWAKAGISLGVGWALIALAGMGERGALLGVVAGVTMVVVACDPAWRAPRAPSEGARQLSRAFLKFGLPLTLTFLSVAVVDVADRLLIGLLLGIEQVAPYAVAYDFVQQSIGMLLGVIFLAAFPIVVRELEEKGEAVAHGRLKELAAAYFAIGVPASAGLAVLADDVAIVLFGDTLAPAAAALIPLLSAAILIGSFKSYFLDVPFQLRHATGQLGFVALGMAVLNVVLNLVLIPRVGVMGSVWATVAAFSCGALASWYLGRRLLRLPWPARDLVKSVLASAVMVAVLFRIHGPSSLGSLMFKVGAGGAVFAAVAVIVNLAGLRTALGLAVARRKRDRQA